MVSFGRRKILVNTDHIDRSNVVDVVLGKALPVHNMNSAESDYLYGVYRGRQPVLQRSKSVRSEINNKLLVNHANEIVSFKVSYLLSEPIVYVGRGESSSAAQIAQLNEMMYMNNKAARDKEIADDFMICGNAYRMALPNKRYEPDGEEPPFNVYTLDPRRTFVVYSSGLGEPPLCGVMCTTEMTVNGSSTADKVYSVYTADRFFEIKNDKITKEQFHGLGMVPIIEYMNSNARLGAFEVVESLLDAINTLASNRVDATEQAVQALTVFYNCDISSKDFEELKRKGALKIKSVDGMQSEVDMLTVDFNQTDQQVLMDSLYDEVLRITGMPSQAMGNTSDSSNNGAAIVRNGWYNAEARAKDTEDLWRESEATFLKLVLRICREMMGLKLKSSEVALKFTRRNYEDLLVRSQVLTTMLANPKIAPRLAFVHCGMFVDAEDAFTESMAWYEKNKQEELERQAPQPGSPQAEKPVPKQEPIEPGE